MRISGMHRQYIALCEYGLLPKSDVVVDKATMEEARLR